MVDHSEMYYEEVTPTNEVKGFTKSFVKRSKDKKKEDKNVVELLNHIKESTYTLGLRTTEKAFKNGEVSKLYVASNCDEYALARLNHYAKISEVEVVQLELDNHDLAQKLAKPFVVSMVCIKN